MILDCDAFFWNHYAHTQNSIPSTVICKLVDDSSENRPRIVIEVEIKLKQFLNEIHTSFTFHIDFDWHEPL